MEEEDHAKINPLKIVSKTGYLKIAAPMVRYSKLAFRELVRIYDVDLAFTPMILADVFKSSIKSRDAELTTSQFDSPLIVQFAASCSKDAADAAEMVAKYCNGVDINCGCPQKWAIKELIGSYLSTQPEIVGDIVDWVKRRTASVKMSDGTSFPCSIKIRICDDLRTTVELCKRAEMMGVDWISVHGRTARQKNSDTVDVEAIRLIKESIQIPVFSNGGVASLLDADDIIAKTKADGVMVAQGLLNNPALFAGYSNTPMKCVKDYICKAIGYGTNHFIFHHHLMYMLDSKMSKAEKRHFNTLCSIPAIIDYLQDHYNINYSH